MNAPEKIESNFGASPDEIIDSATNEERIPPAVKAAPEIIRGILETALEGCELDFTQAMQLATAEGAALDALIAVADHLRRQTVGDAITYVVNRNINFTNVCFVGCSFCR